MKFYKHSRVAGRMLTGLMMTVLLIMASCSKNSSADLTDILQTVPSDAASVGVYNTDDLMKKAGGKSNVDNGNMDAALSQLVNVDSQSQAIVNAIMKVESGVEAGPGAFFVEGKQVYITGQLANPTDFMGFCGEQLEGSFEDVQGVSILKNVAVKDNRFWIMPEGNSAIDSNEIVRFVALSKEQSFLSNPASERMLKMDNDIEAWCNINGIMNLGAGQLKDVTVMRMVFASLFDDAQDMYFTTEFDKGKMESTLEILNSKGKAAKFLLPAVKIDGGTVKKLGGTACLVAAMGIDKKLVSKVKELMMSFGGSVPDLYMQVLNALDGTICLAFDPKVENVNGIVTTTGDGTAALTSALNSLGTVNKDGKYLFIKKGEVSGDLSIDDVASTLNGSMFGFVVSHSLDTSKFSMPNVRDNSDMIESVAILITPSDGGMKLEIKVNGTDKNNNILESIVKSGSAK